MSSYMQMIGALEARVGSLEQRVGELVERGARVDRARAFLERVLRDGPREPGEILRLGAAEGHAPRTIYRASDEIGVESARERGASGRVRVVWKLRAAGA